MQEQVKDFIKAHDLNADAQIRYIDLISEIGELGKEILKDSGFGKRPYSQGTGSTEEMGDCLFSLLALCCGMGINAQAALDGALAKYQSRFLKKGHMGSDK